VRSEVADGKRYDRIDSRRISRPGLCPRHAAARVPLECKEPLVSLRQRGRRRRFPRLERHCGDVSFGPKGSSG
jgi:hypothetical protein